MGLRLDCSGEEIAEISRGWLMLFTCWRKTITVYSDTGYISDTCEKQKPKHNRWKQNVWLCINILHPLPAILAKEN